MWLAAWHVISSLLLPRLPAPPQTTHDIQPFKLAQIVVSGFEDRISERPSESRRERRGQTIRNGGESHGDVVLGRDGARLARSDGESLEDDRLASRLGSRLGRRVRLDAVEEVIAAALGREGLAGSLEDGTGRGAGSRNEERRTGYERTRRTTWSA